MSNKTFNILIFPAGEINSVELHDALSYCANIRVFGASSIERHGSYIFENYTPGLPRITDADFIQKFNTLLTEKQIDFIFPTHDTIAEFLTAHASELVSKVIAANASTAQICRDKAATYKALRGEAFIPNWQIGQPVVFPAFVKPRKGQGSVGAKLVNTPKDLPIDINWEEYISCEYLPGEEFTVDCLTDKDGALAAVLPRSRKRIMAGVCVAGQSEQITPQIMNIARTINTKMKFNGLWFFQIKKDKNNQWKLLEISTRCAGTMCLSRARGVNLPLLSVYTAAGLPVRVSPNSYNLTMDRTLISRYKIDYPYHTVYLDFDDTLTLRGKLNLKTIWFVYQCRNHGKKVILLTKHAKNLKQTLQQYALSPDVFDQIIHLSETDSKANFIFPDGAIFIDNAYQERIRVAEKHHIPVFDADTLEVLMDWKI